jgi:hypothetical protein
MTERKRESGAKRIQRTPHLRWVPVAKMKVSPSVTQRMKLNQAHVDHIAADFDPDKLDAPSVNHVGDWYYILAPRRSVEADRLGRPADPMLDL